MRQKNPYPLAGPLSPNPRVSVLLPFYQCGAELDAAISSIAAQVYRDWELLLIDNNANETARQIAIRRAQTDPRIRLLHEPEQGIAFALNTGLKQARGLYIARMDADDWSHPDRLVRQVDFLDTHPAIDAVATQTRFESSMGVSQGYDLFVQWQNDIVSARQHYISRFIESPIAHPTICFRKSLIDKHGLYDTGKVPEDYELWLRWFDKGVGFYKIPEALLTWNDHPARLSRNHDNYSREAFFTVKCMYLARWIQRALPSEKKIVVCGSSKIGLKRARLLTGLGVDVYGFTDVKKRPNRQVRFIPIAEMTTPEPWFLINFISKRGVGPAIREHFSALGFVEGRDFILAG